MSTDKIPKNPIFFWRRLKAGLNGYVIRKIIFVKNGYLNIYFKFGHPGSAFLEKEDFENRRYGFQHMYERFMQQLVSAFTDGLTVWDSNSIASNLYDFEKSLNKVNTKFI